MENIDKFLILAAVPSILYDCSSNDYGAGYGAGAGNGSGYGYGDGAGDGAGDGYGYGYGNDNGNGYGNYKLFNGKKVYTIDNLPTLIHSIIGNVAFGSIINKDLTVTKTFIVKNEFYHAHGKTIKEALLSLQDKIDFNLTIEEKLINFKTKFNTILSYPAIELFEWHNKLTGSCLQGRENFCKNHNINLKTDTFTIEEFVKLTQNEYGGNIIKQLL